MVVYDEKFVKKLKRDITTLKWKNLSRDEAQWALRAFYLLTWKWPFSKEEFEFIESYVEQKEAEEREIDMPF